MTRLGYQDVGMNSTPRLHASWYLLSFIQNIIRNMVSVMWGFDIWYSPVRTDSHPSTVDAELIKNDEILNFAVDVKFWLRNYGNFATQIGLRRSPWLAESYTRILPAVAESSCSAPWLHACTCWVSCQLEWHSTINDDWTERINQW